MEITTDNIKEYVGQKVWLIIDIGEWAELTYVNDMFCVLEIWGRTHYFTLKDLGKHYFLFTEKQEEGWG